MQQDNFNERISKLIDFLDITQAEMGKKLGVSRNLVSMMARKEKPQKPSKTVRLLFDAEWQKAFGEGETPIESEFLRSDESGGYGRGRQCLKRAREAAGMSQLELAKAVGYTLGIYQNIEEGRSNLSRKMAERLAASLRIPVDDLLGGGDHVAENTVPYGTMGETPDIAVPPGMKVKYVPLLAMAECGTSKAWTDDGYTHQGYVVFDPTDPQTYAVKLTGESMLPVFSPGDVAIVTPSKPLRNGCVVIARLDEDHGGDVMLKLYQGNAETVTLSSYNPAFPAIAWPRSAFALIHYVSEVNKKLG